jgi:hypothetical protein
MWVGLLAGPFFFDINNLFCYIDHLLN